MNNSMTKSTTVVFVVLAILVLGVIVFLTYKSPAAPVSDTATTTAPAAAAPAAPTKAPVSSGVSTKVLPTGTSGTAPAIGLSKVLLRDSSGISLYSGVDPSGRIVYKPIPGVDAATFQALTELDAVEHPATKDAKGIVTSLGVGSVAFYKDKNSAYILSVFQTTGNTETAIEVAQGADPASFAPLSSWYAKDKMNVYRLDAPADTSPYVPGSYSWRPYDLAVITNADAASFVLVSDPSLNYDAHDKTHTYRKGVLVGTYPG